ncbi:MAG: phosphohistidine phosphatase [Cellvibrionaceae bacterium]|jgi:phosphohistidine phosphatase
MELLLMRHAKSDWGEGVSDFDRPLNERGEDSAEKMGRLLLDEGLVPDAILCSLAQRARETAEGVLEGSDYDGPKVFYTDRLYLCDIRDFIAVIKQYGGDHQRILVIAHNPGTEGFIHHLTGEDKRVTTANLAKIDLEIGAWADFDVTTKGTLTGFWRPREPQF